MNKTIEAVKNVLVRNNVPVFGVTESSRLENEPPGHRPSDTLSDARSMMCVGIPVPKGVFQNRDRALHLYWRTANIYYRVIDAVLLRISCIIEQEGHTAAPVFG
jgi:hypothetical protein